MAKAKDSNKERKKETKKTVANMKREENKPKDSNVNAVLVDTTIRHAMKEVEG